MKLFLSALFLLTSLTGPQVNAEIYQSTDSEGNISYSDSSTDPQTTKITPQPSNIVPAQTVNKKKALIVKDKTSLPTHIIQIITPINDAVIRNNQGEVSINISIQPPLNPENKIQTLIYLDEKIISQGLATSISITNIDRGTHTIRASLISTSGEVLTQSNKVTIHLKRHSSIPVHKTLRY